jgi:Rap1a immunity proteins
MFQFLRGAVLVAAMLGSCVMSFAEDLFSANAIMPGCREFNSPSGSNGAITFKTGLCLGIVSTFNMIGSYVNICSPDNVTNNQLVRVVVKYIDDRPARWHEDFRLLAQEALFAAWPCKK